MKYCLRVLIVCLLYGYSFSAAVAQRDSSSGFIISHSPQYILAQGFRMDVDKQLGLSRSWLIVSGQLYGGNLKQSYWARTAQASETDNIDDNISGYGIELNYRLFLLKKNKGLYVMTGANYSYFNIEYQQYTFKPETINGENFYEYKRGPEHQYIKRWMANLVVGYQASVQLSKTKKLFVKYITFDGYVGTSFRQSTVEDTLPRIRNYIRTPWDFAVNGFCPVLMFRIGFGFN